MSGQCRPHSSSAQLRLVPLEVQGPGVLQVSRLVAEHVVPLEPLVITEGPVGVELSAPATVW